MCWQRCKKTENNCITHSPFLISPVFILHSSFSDVDPQSPILASSILPLSWFSFDFLRHFFFSLFLLSFFFLPPLTPLAITHVPSISFHNFSSPRFFHLNLNEMVDDDDDDADDDDDGDDDDHHARLLLPRTYNLRHLNWQLAYCPSTPSSMESRFPLMDFFFDDLEKVCDT